MSVVNIAVIMLLIVLWDVVITSSSAASGAHVRSTSSPDTKRMDNSRTSRR